MQTIPAEKVIPGTHFTVDGFKHCSVDVKAYFLSHAHSDHYTGLTENWNLGIIHCSTVTAKLVVHLLGIKPEFLNPLAMDCIHHIQGVKVVLVDANHCPGAVQFLFELPNGEKYIHCGDMRFGPHLLHNPHLKHFQDANAVFLDTTYCNPKYTFPPQEEAVQYVASTVDRLLIEQKQQGLKRVYVISTYVIGKERLLVAVHRKTGCKIGVTQQKLDTMNCLDLPGVDLDEVFTTDLASTPVHVAKWGFLGESWPFFRPNFVNMEQYRTDMGVDEVVGFVPTGWMYEMKRKAFPVRDKGPCFIHLVPYSEHSSYSELREYVRFLRPHKVMPTVGVHADDASGKKSANMQKHFRHLVNETASKQRFLRSLHKTNSAREGSGSLLTCLTQAACVKQEPAIAEATDSHDFHGQALAQPARAKDASVVNVKQEGVVKEDSEVSPFGNAGPSDFSLADSAGLPESLGEELGDAACMKADPDSLMADALHPSTGLPEAPDAAVSPPAIGAKQSVVQPGPHEGPADHTAVVREFLDILGDAVDADTATDFVCKAGGRLSAAINSYYDSADVLLGSTATAAMKVSSAEQASSSETSAKSAAHSLAQSADKAAPVSAAKKQATQQPYGKQVGKGKKRTATAAAQMHATDKPTKKQRSAPTAQRSISTFFGTGQPSVNVKSGNGKQQAPDGAAKNTPDKGGVCAQPEVRSSEQEVNAPQHGIASLRQPAILREDTAAPPGRANHVDAIDLAGNSMEHEDICGEEGGVAKQAASPTGTQAAHDPYHMPAEAPSDHVEGKSEQVGDAADTQQPVHPFFEKGKSQIKKAEAKAVDRPAAVDASLMSANQGNGSADRPFVRSKGDVADSEGKVSLAKQEPPRRNPFQKAQSEPEKDVPVDAVLLPTSEYDPVKMAVWEAGQATPYRHISRAFQAMESTTKRLRIGDAIANMFRSILALSPDCASGADTVGGCHAFTRSHGAAENMLQAAYLTIGKLAPDYENVELSVGGSTVAAAVVEATGTSRAKLREMYNELGDMGDVAQACRHTQTMLHRPAPLTVPGVYKTLRQIALEKGQGSAARRQQAVLGMLRSCREHETKFLVRTLVSNLRVGANWRSVIGAMARAVVMHREGSRVPKARLDAAATKASEAYHVCPNLDILVPALVEGGIDELEKRCALTPDHTRHFIGRFAAVHLIWGVPLKPMLAKISEGIPDAIKQLKGEPFLAEYKYDGTRAQIHLLPDNSVKVFSRNCEDKTVSMPDVVAAIQAAAKGGSTSLVLDAELVAVDRADGNRLKAFQELSTRARGEIAAHQVTMHVCVFVFDLLYVDGDSLVHLPLRQRRSRLASALPNLQLGHVQLATSLEFQPAAVCMAVAAAASKEASLASASNSGLPASADKEGSAADVSKRGPATAGQEGCAPSGAQASQPAQWLQNSAINSGDDAHCGDDANDDVVMSDMSSSSGQRHKLDSNQHALGGSDIDATAAAAAAAQDALPQAAAAPGLTEGAAAAGAEAVVSDLAVQSIEDRIQEFLLESFAGGTEGLMLKALDVAAGYQPSKRSDSWIKLKRDYCEGLRDSLDLVVIGAWYGQGRKVKWYSPFLLAAYDPETEEYQSVCRCMSGFSDAFYAEKTAQFKATSLPGKKAYYRTDESPDVWFEPTEVWEIRGADLTVSPVHKAAVGHIHPDRGISLRFPRFITIRSDRRPEDASTPEVIVDLYNKQSRRMTSAAEMLASKNKSKSVVGDVATGVSDQEDDGGPDGDAMDS